MALNVLRASPTSLNGLLAPMATEEPRETSYCCDFHPLMRFGFYMNRTFLSLTLRDQKVRDSEREAGDAMPDDRPRNKKPTRPGQAEEVEMEEAPAPVPAAHGE
jgi:hypothetical protein